MTNTHTDTHTHTHKSQCFVFMFVTFYSVIIHVGFYMILGKDGSFATGIQQRQRENSKGQGSIGLLFSPDKNRQWVLLPKPELSVPV